MYVMGLALPAIFVYVVSRGVLRELDDAADRLSAALRPAARPGRDSARGCCRLLLGRLPPAAALYHAIGGARPTLLLDQALGVTRNTIDVAARIIVVVALSAYWSASREAFERLWLSLVPAPQRPRARDVWRAVERAVGSHMRGEVAAERAVRAGAGGDVPAGAPAAADAAGARRRRAAPGPVLRRAAAAAGAAFLAGSTVGLAAGAAAAVSPCWSSWRSSAWSRAGCSPRAVPARR